MDYKEKSCYAVSVNEAHLAAGANWPRQKVTHTLNNTSITAKHQIGFTTYGTQAVRNQLFTAASAYLIWAKIREFIHVPEDEWMPIPLRPDAKLTGAKVY